MNSTPKTLDRAAAAALALVLAVLMTPAEAQRAKTGKPAAPVYAGIIVKYKSTSSMRATAMSAATQRSVEDRARVKLAGARQGAMDLAVYRFAKPMAAAEARAAATRIALDPDDQ